MFPMTDNLRTLLQAQHAPHERLKKARHIFPQVFLREVAEERGGDKKPKAITSFNKVWKWRSQDSVDTLFPGPVSGFELLRADATEVAVPP